MSTVLDRLTPEDIAAASFPPAAGWRRGLDEAQVREYLGLLAAGFGSLYAELEELRARNTFLETRAEHDYALAAGSGQSALQVLTQAQATAEQVAAEAQRYRDELIAATRVRCEQAVAEAKRQAQGLVAEAGLYADRLREEAGLQAVRAAAESPGGVSDLLREHMRAQASGVLAFLDGLEQPAVPETPPAEDPVQPEDQEPEKK